MLVSDDVHHAAMMSTMLLYVLVAGVSLTNGQLPWEQLNGVRRRLASKTVSVRTFTSNYDGAGTSDNVNVKFMVDGSYGSEQTFFTSTQSKGEVKQTTYTLSNWPTKLQFVYDKGSAGWGIYKVAICEGEIKASSLLGHKYCTTGNGFIILEDPNGETGS